MNYYKSALICKSWVMFTLVLSVPGAGAVAAEFPESVRRLDHNPMAKALAGERYSAMVPDTLDLADRMGLAVNALTNVWFPDEKWGLGFVVDFSRRPAVLLFNHVTDAYLNIPSKFVEALAVCRLASGERKNVNVDLEVLRVQLSLLGTDGALYAPTDTFKKHEGPRGFSEVWGEGRHLLALSMLAQIDDDPRWVEIGRRKIDRMLSLTREKDGFRFLWKGRYRPGEMPPADADEPNGKIKGGSLADNRATFSMIYSVGALGHGSGLFYRVTGYAPALELSRGLARWALARMFGGDTTRIEIKAGKLELVGHAVALAEGVSEKDVLLEVDASSDAEAGFVIRAKDHENYLLANYSPAAGGIYFHEVVNGAWGPVLDHVAVKGISGDIHLTAKVEGARVTFSISGGATRFTTTHPIDRYTAAGRFGLFHNKTPGQRFDNFRIADLGGRKLFADGFDRPDGPSRGWDAGFEEGQYEFWHFHHGLYALMAICEYGVAAHDREVLERVDACYRWAREFGDPLVGFYPESMSWDYPTTEICGVSDMVFLALNLTRAGLGDYWDDVDRWVRNMYAEGQMCDTSGFEGIPDRYFNDAPAGHVYQDTRDIRERSVGSFWGWMRPNEGLRVDVRDGQPKLASHSIMHCCTANGARTFYYVWDGIVTHEKDLVRVNLLLNRASRWLDVDSYLPVEGKVVLHIKDAPKVAVRMPEWCVPFEVTVQVGDASRRPHVKGRYVHLDGLKTGDEVTLTFPVSERVVDREIVGKTYRMKLRGANVVDIEPKGVACPLYANQPKGKLVKKTRFVPKTERIVW